MRTTAIQFLFKCLLIGLGLAAAESTHSGIEIETAGDLVLVSLLLGLLNATIRPILILFTLPFVLLTLGLGLIIINALLILLTGQLWPGFTVGTFWAGLWAALLVSVVSLLATAIFQFPKMKGKTRFTYTARVQGRDGRVREYGNSSSEGAPKRIRGRADKDDVIDI